MADRGPKVVCFPFVGDDLGGSHISAAKLIRALDPQRTRAIVALHEIDGPLAPFLDSEGIAFVQAPASALLGKRASPLGGLWQVATRSGPEVRRFLRRHGVDIIHTNDGRIHATWSIAGRLAGARVLWHHRGDPDARGVNLLAPVFADRIVTVSRFARPTRPLLPIDRKWTVVHSPFEHPPPLDREEAHRLVTDAAGLPRETRLIAYFGQFLERKRPEDLVDVLAALRARAPEMPVAALLFGADAPGRPPLEQATRARAEALGVGDAVRFMGFRYPVDAWLAGVDVLVVPALSEPFGRTLIEAMLLRTPVVAADHGGNREAIVSAVNGFLAPPCRPEGYVEAILRLFADPALRSRIVETAHAEATSRYGVARHVRAIEAIYGELAQRRPRERAASPESEEEAA